MFGVVVCVMRCGVVFRCLQFLLFFSLLFLFDDDEKEDGWWWNRRKTKTRSDLILFFLFIHSKMLTIKVEDFDGIGISLRSQPFRFGEKLNSYGFESNLKSKILTMLPKSSLKLITSTWCCLLSFFFASNIATLHHHHHHHHYLIIDEDDDDHHHHPHRRLHLNQEIIKKRCYQSFFQLTGLMFQCKHLHNSTIINIWLWCAS